MPHKYISELQYQFYCQVTTRCHMVNTDGSRFPPIGPNTPHDWWLSSHRAANVRRAPWGVRWLVLLAVAKSQWGEEMCWYATPECCVIPHRGDEGAAVVAQRHAALLNSRPSSTCHCPQQHQDMWDWLVFLCATTRRGLPYRQGQRGQRQFETARPAAQQ